MSERKAKEFRSMQKAIVLLTQETASLSQALNKLHESTNILHKEKTPVKKWWQFWIRERTS